MSRKAKEEYYRFFSVTDVRTHEKGYTEYKVTARFVSKLCPENAKEVVVWRRYSELKKLHGELAYTHKNLFRKEEEFPPFPPAQVFGRFDEAVIEQRRQAAETMLVFATGIAGLYNSPQLNDFFRGGDVSRPLDPCLDDSDGALAPPLIPLPELKASDHEVAEEEQGQEAPILPQDLGNNLGINLGVPEVAVEALGDVGVDVAANGGGQTEDDAPRELEGRDWSDPESEPPYLNRAAAELTAAEARETAGDVGAAISGYRAAVDILIRGAKDDGDPARKESVKRRIAGYLEHAEKLLTEARARDL
ncbi:sorting nexin-15 isoform X2 [Stigmatopora nigra]